MIYSMTGFGRAEGQVLDRAVSVEMRSVNQRHRDINVRLPKNFSLLEEPVKKVVAEKISRGRIDVWIQVDEPADAGKRLKVDLELARAYYGHLLKLKDELDLPDKVSLQDVVRLNDVVRFEEDRIDLDVFLAGLTRIVRQAVDNLAAMRETEGRAIAADFWDRLDRMAGWVGGIDARRQVVPQEAKARLLSRMEALTQGLDLDQNRLLQEVTYLVDRSDVTEEIVRLSSHFKQFSTLLDSREAVGRKLEFLLQEMNREVNTIGSKSQDLTITQAVVDLKSELEKIREQVMNVE